MPPLALQATLAIHFHECRSPENPRLSQINFENFFGCDSFEFYESNSKMFDYLKLLLPTHGHFWKTCHLMDNRWHPSLGPFLSSMMVVVMITSIHEPDFQMGIGMALGMEPNDNHASDLGVDSSWKCIVPLW